MQIPNEHFIRSEPGAAGAVKTGSPRGSSTPSSPSSPISPTSPTYPSGPSQRASQALAQLEALRNNKMYQQFKEYVIYAGEFTADPQHSIHDCPRLLTHLVKNLYKGHPYLSLLLQPGSPGQ